MIIELFGPPGAGKTTFARALAARLRERGHVAELVLSYRPAERLRRLDPCAATPAPRQTAAVVRRLTRPVVEMLTLARHPFVNSHDVSTAVNLIRILPPKNLIWSIRLSQYISRLSHSWFQASGARHIVLFDQGYVQAVCSLAVVGRATSETVLAHALDFTPKSDLLIRLNAPEDVLMARLCERHRSQGAIERFLELDLNRNIEAIRITERLYDLLRERGQPVTCASSLDQRSLRESVEQIEQQLVSKLATERTGAA
jgi:adenylate kinase family enzyme